MQLSLHQLQSSKLLWRMKAVTHRRLPGKIFSIRTRPLTSEKIDAKGITDLGRARIDGSIWNFHRSIPNVRRLIDARRNLEAGIPFPAAVVVLPVEVNIQVDPLAARRDLEFLIAFDVRKV